MNLHNILFPKNLSTASEIIPIPHLPLDIYRHILSLIQLRLRDIINLSMVSKSLRTLALLEENWYIIMDTKKILYDFVRKIFQSDSGIAYPFFKIRQMHSTNYRDIFHFDGLDYPDLLRIIPRNQVDLMKFYEYFADYQHSYVNEELSYDSFSPFKKSIHAISGQHIYFILGQTAGYNVTEIFIPDNHFDCVVLPYCPQIEKLEVLDIINGEHLKQSKLKYLRINDGTLITTILPDAIESLVVMNSRHKSLIFDQLKDLPHLNYLKINLPFAELTTTLNINTIHFIISCKDQTNITLDIPNVKNIILTHDRIICQIKKLHVTAHKAVTCCLVNIYVHDLSLVLPNCPKIITHDDDDRAIINYDDNVF
jgi:hypothetical protein